MDKVMIDASEKGKMRHDSDPGPSFVTGPGSGPTAKKRGTDYKKRERSPGPGPSEVPIEQAPKRGTGRPKKQPPV